MPPLRITSQSQQNEQPPPEMEAIPQTFLIECNRATANYQDGLNNALNRWTTTFNNGIDLKVGDRVSINSAYLSSVGVGDLIQFELDETSPDQDNKATWLFDYYVVNDGCNDKRSEVNVNEGPGIFKWDVTNNDCLLYRYDIQAEKFTFDAGARTLVAQYHQDPYFPLEYYGTKVNHGNGNVPVSTGDFNSLYYAIRLYRDNDTDTGSSLLSIVQLDPGTAPNGVLDPAFDARNMLMPGSSYQLIAQDIGNGYGFPSYYNDPIWNIAFTVARWFQGTPNGLPNGWYASITNLSGIMEEIGVTSATVSGELYDLGVGLESQWGAQGDRFLYPPVFDETVWTSLEGTTLTQAAVVYPDAEGPEAGGPYNINTFNYQALVLQDKRVEDAIFKVRIEQFAPVDFTNWELGDEYEIILQVSSAVGSILSVADVWNLNSQSRMLCLRTWNGTAYNYHLLYGGDGALSVPSRNRLNFDGYGFYPCIEQNWNALNPPAQVGPSIFGALQIVNDDNYPHQIFFCGKMINGITVRPINQNQYGLNLDAGQKLNNPFVGVGAAYYFFNGTPPANYEVTGNQTRNPFDIPYSVYGRIGFDENVANDPNGGAPLYETLFTDRLHREQFSFEINETWNSPEDIATALTEQTHALQNIRDSVTGEEIEGTAGFGLPQNRLCIPVHNVKDFGEVFTGGIWQMGGVSGADLRGNFSLYDNYENVGVTPRKSSAWGAPTTITKDDVQIYFRGAGTSVNKPVAFKDGTGTDRIPSNDPVLAGLEDYDQTLNPQFAKSYNNYGAVVGYPMIYYDDGAGVKQAVISQWAGANDITFGWDTTQSRMTIGNMHIGRFSFDDGTADNVGGTPSVNIYLPAVPYKQNQTRSTGIRIRQWAGYKGIYGETPLEMLARVGLPNNQDLDGNEWYFNKVEPVGNKFWTKLGFINRPTEWDSTTRNEIDSTFNIIAAGEPAANRPNPLDLVNDSKGSNTSVPAGYEDSSFGSLNLNGHAVGAGGVVDTAGRPRQFEVLVTADTVAKYLVSEQQYNPDKEMSTAYSVQADTSLIVADALPIKTEWAYFFVLSDIITGSNFYTTRGNGQRLPIMGVVNKLNSDNDFYMSYPSSQSFYIEHDRFLTSITVEILNPDMSYPGLISSYSSIIFQVDRYNPVPADPSPPLWSIQDEWFQNLQELVGGALRQNGIRPTPERQMEVIEQLFDTDVQTQTDPLEAAIQVVAELPQLTGGEIESGIGTSVATSAMGDPEREAPAPPAKTRGRVRGESVTTAERVEQAKTERQTKQIAKRLKTSKPGFALKPEEGEARAEYVKRAKEFYKRYQQEGEASELPYLKPPEFDDEDE